jgi:hypothetical protein
VHFTREPILETIISARDGQKISIRKASSQAGETSEEYIVDSVEVVSFGGNLFFRSQEKPKPFLLPTAHYELVEVKETRIVLKSANLEKSIKIGGGKEQPHHKAAKEHPAEIIVEEIEQDSEKPEEVLPKQENVQYSAQMESRADRKRDRRKRRRGRDEREWQERNAQQQAMASQSTEDVAAKAQVIGQETNIISSSAEQETPSEQGTQVPPVIPFATLIPPPTTLISETLSRYKEVMFGEMSTKKDAKGAVPEEAETIIEIQEEVIYEEKKPEAQDNNASDEPLTRVRLDETYFDKGGFGPQF